MLTMIATMTIAALAVFAFRRVLFLGASLRAGDQESRGTGVLPSVVLLVPAHDEASTVDSTLSALAGLDYPPALLSLVLIDDASEDGTPDHFDRWAAGRPGTIVLRLRTRHGKAAALNAGLAAAPAGDLIAICDADLRPRPGALASLAGTFADSNTAAAAPYLSPENAGKTGAAAYAAVESWVHQLVSSSAKDRLRLNPPTNGGSVYRRSALASLGGFPVVPSGEDISTTVALTHAGWRTRFVRDAVFDNTVAQTWKHYWHQHLRWSRNLLSTAVSRSTSRLSPAMRLELAMQSAGYADRLALLMAIALAATGILRVWIPVAYASLIAAQVTVAVVVAGEARRLPRYTFWTVAFYSLDAVATLVSFVFHALDRPRQWRRARGVVTPLTPD